MPTKNKLADIKSPSFPGGSLLRGLLDRELMTQADRGSASAMIGDRWADITSDLLTDFPGREMQIPGSRQTYRVDHVLRLDDDPSISLRASRNGLQNPDFLFVGLQDGNAIVQAADAKFSVETARSKQVSEEVVANLFESGITDEKVVCGDLTHCEHVPGLFLSPDGFLTQHVLSRGRGIRKVAVRRDELLLLDATSPEMFQGMEGFEVSEDFWRVDRHSFDPREHLGVGLYYFRLIRSAIANWRDERRPLFELRPQDEFDLTSFRHSVVDRSQRSKCSWRLVLEWSRDADIVRAQRKEIDNALTLPISNARLRELVEAESAKLGIEPPSLNRVRRKVGWWMRQEVHRVVGELQPPVEDLDEELRSIKQEVRQMKVPMIAEIATAVAKIGRESSRNT